MTIKCNKTNDNKNEYIKCFDKVEDIDFDFLKMEEDIDYKYSGEYSVMNFLKRIDESIQKR